MRILELYKEIKVAPHISSLTVDKPVNIQMAYETHFLLRTYA